MSDYGMSRVWERYPGEFDNYPELKQMLDWQSNPKHRRNKKAEKQKASKLARKITRRKK